MVKPGAGASVHKPRYKRSTERQNFMSSSIKDMYQAPSQREPTAQQDMEDEELDMRKILKDIQHLGSSHMSWKERKKFENQNVVALGGKPPKKQRIPLNIAKKMMKNEKRREEKKLAEGLILEQFGMRSSSNSNKEVKRKAEDRGLRATEGHFRNGVLNVKHLLQPNKSSKDNHSAPSYVKGKKNGKKGAGKKARATRSGDVSEDQNIPVDRLQCSWECLREDQNIPVYNDEGAETARGTRLFPAWAGSHGDWQLWRSELFYLLPATHVRLLWNVTKRLTKGPSRGGRVVELLLS
ncbi:hypothetical protein H6P81_007927 [Aristolochia fimbriata]|uniref:Uncharacterized protein n=1 Tax=Aristolochia fimbriata TaxID=158543 RepID=A0AAV7F1W6_ARIFI|nr:hypothetical protein H6P81_007927 [Aristolochia fimbriata]